MPRPEVGAGERSRSLEALFTLPDLPPTNSVSGGLAPSVREPKREAIVAPGAVDRPFLKPAGHQPGPQGTRSSWSRLIPRFSAEVDWPLFTSLVGNAVLLSLLAYARWLSSVGEPVVIPIRHAHPSHVPMRLAPPALKPKAPRVACAPDEALGRVAPPPPAPPSDSVVNPLRTKPEHPLAQKVSAPWSVGCHSETGPVRATNDDCGEAFVTNGCSILILADGMGGVPQGGRAAREAVSAAAGSLRLHLDASPGQPAPPRDLGQLCQKAIGVAALGIHRHSVEHGVSAADLGTTLIVVVAKDDRVGYAYSGDGGILRIDPARTSKRCEQLLTAAKPSQNELPAYLSTQVIGEVHAGELQRSPGEVVLIGTDGVFDYLPHDTIGLMVLDAMFRAGGDFDAALRVVLQQFASFRDDQGYAHFSDNLSLAAVGTGGPPMIPPGFWGRATAASIEEQRTEATRVDSVGLNQMSPANHQYLPQATANNGTVVARLQQPVTP